jgi:hypothetical protein
LESTAPSGPCERARMRITRSAMWSRLPGVRAGARLAVAPADQPRPADTAIRRALAECMTLTDIDDAMSWTPGTARRRRWRAPDHGGLPNADAEIGGVAIWFRRTIEVWQAAPKASLAGAPAQPHDSDAAGPSQRHSIPLPARRCGPSSAERTRTRVCKHRPRGGSRSARTGSPLRGRRRGDHALRPGQQLSNDGAIRGRGRRTKQCPGSRAAVCPRVGCEVWI